MYLSNTPHLSVQSSQGRWAQKYLLTQKTHAPGHVVFRLYPWSRFHPVLRMLARRRQTRSTLSLGSAPLRSARGETDSISLMASCSSSHELIRCIMHPNGPMDSYLIISAMRGSAGGTLLGELFQEGSRYRCNEMGSCRPTTDNPVNWRIASRSRRIKAQQAVCALVTRRNSIPSDKRADQETNYV